MPYFNTTTRLNGYLFSKKFISISLYVKISLHSFESLWNYRINKSSFASIFKKITYFLFLISIFFCTFERTILSTIKKAI